MVCAAVAFGLRIAADAAPLDFARDIHPILVENCLDCHGAENPKGGLRLTSRQHALEGGYSGIAAIEPGKSAESLLIELVTSEDDSEVMPQKRDRLKPADIDRLRRWIDEGAAWPDDLKHWAYVKPVRPVVPPIGDAQGRAHNPIDHFVLARLAREGLAQSPEADRAQWLRRVSLDLIGLPPTPAEVDAFLADTAPDAHARVVDRLLASPHYGERWARPWLDLARYADSHGFQRDDLRDLWPYRDWVIRAMNADMAFDQFTIWQLAGDLLPDRAEENLDPLIATGFHRCAPTNVEAGADQEEGRVGQIFDRVNTTAAVWLGTTLECAQCHDHKYDPFSQRDYYQLFAYFNNTQQETDFARPGAMASLKFVGPYLDLPDPDNADARRAAQQRADELRAAVNRLRKPLLAAFEIWIQTTAGELLAGPAADAIPANIARILATPTSERTTSEGRALERYYLSRDKHYRSALQASNQAAARVRELQPPRT